MFRLLVVDVEEGIRYAIRVYFGRRRVEVFTAANKEEALSLFKQKNPAFVLLDVNFSQLLGFIMCKERMF